MKELNKQIQKQFEKMCATGKLFRSNIEGELLWMAYLEGFGEDGIFRDPSSSIHNCNTCHSFIKRYGGIVAVSPEYELMTLFDIPEEDVPDEYKGSVRELKNILHSGGIRDIFVETYHYLSDPKTPYETNPKRNQETYKLGLESNVKVYMREDVDRWPDSGFKVGDTHTFDHMFIKVPREFITFESVTSREAVMGKARSTKDVFERGLKEIPADTIQLVLDLEAQGSLLNGTQYRWMVEKFLVCSKEYNKLSGRQKEFYAWVKSIDLGAAAGVRNTAIGTLMVDLSQGKEINEACKAFNIMVDPVNYKKASAPVTKRQIEEAEKFVEANGYADSFTRRCATIQDIKVSDILHTSVDAAQVKTKLSVFSGIAPTAPSRHKKSEFKDVQEVGIEKFMSDILPGCSSVEVFLDNKHDENFVTLITAENKDSKRIFGWDNNFSWTYSGGLAGKSMITKAVKAAGGNVDAPFRASAIWNETGDAMHTDFDIHCEEYGIKGKADHIYYANHNVNKNMSIVQSNLSLGGGVLDIDIRDPKSQCGGGVAVENIFYPDLSRLADGTYKFYVNNYNGGSNNGFRAEIFFDGDLYQYEKKGLTRGNVILATITIKSGKIESIDHNKSVYVGEGDGEFSKRDVYGLSTGEFHRVSLVCLSPNYWQDHGVGNKHYFFMLEGACCPDSIRTIHNEYLNSDLREHRKVMEVLGSKLRCDSVKGQLSGLGFNSTVRDEVIVRCKGSHTRVLKIKF